MRIFSTTRSTRHLMESKWIGETDKLSSMHFSLSTILSCRQQKLGKSKVNIRRKQTAVSGDQSHFPSVQAPGDRSRMVPQSDVRSHETSGQASSCPAHIPGAIGTQSLQCRELDNIDGEPVVFEWKIFAGHTTLKHLCEVQNMMRKIVFCPKGSKIESSSCRCTTTSIGDKKTMKNFVYRVPQVLLHTPQSFPKNIGDSSDLDLKTNGTLRSLTSNGSWNRVAELMMINFRESRHPVQRNKCFLSWSAKKQRRWKNIKT